MSSTNFSPEGTGPAGLDAVLPPSHRAESPAPDPADVAPHPVDQVAVRKLGGFNLMSPEKWSAMRVGGRRKRIRAGCVTFLHEGQEVPLRAALLGLQQQARG